MQQLQLCVFNMDLHTARSSPTPHATVQPPPFTYGLYEPSLSRSRSSVGSSTSREAGSSIIRR